MLTEMTMLDEIEKERIRAKKIAWTAQICKRSFYRFVKEFWPVISPETPVWNWHIEYLCDELQKVAERVIARQPKEYDLLINVPPGTTKSTICTIMFPAWLWIPDPSLKVMSASYSSSLSLEHADKSREIIRSDKYRQHFMDIQLKSNKDLKSNYENSKMGARFSTSVGGTATGMHAHIIIVDDPLNPKQAVSNLERAAGNNWLDSTLSTRKIDKGMTPLILIMQRLHVDDCTGHMLKKGTKVKHICLPATLDGVGTVNPPELKRFYVNKLLDPKRLGRRILDEMRKDMGEYNYCGQIEQHPIPRDGVMFNIEKMNVIRGFDPKDISTSVRYWDKAATKDGGAYTAGVLMHRLKNGRFVIADVRRGQWQATVREARIKQTAEIDGKNVKIVTEQEPGSGGKESAEGTIRNLAGFMVYTDRVTGSKEVRAEPYAVQVDNGNIDVVMANWTNEFISEHETFPMGRFRDQVDATSGAFNILAAGAMSAGTWGTRR